MEGISKSKRHRLQRKFWIGRARNVVGRQYLVFAYVMSAERREHYGLPKNGRDALIAGRDLPESSNPYADGLTNDDPGIVSR